MRLLVIHQNFPGQFGHLVQAWSQRAGWDVRALGSATAPGLPGFEGLRRYRLARPGRDGQHPYLRQMESATLHGRGFSWAAHPPLGTDAAGNDGSLARKAA